MLPALDMFRPKGRDLQGRGAFLKLGIPIPPVWNVIASLAFFMPLRDADSHPRKPKKMSRRIRFRNYPKAQNPHYILLLRHNTGRTLPPQGSARRSVRFWAGERGNALTPHDPARRAS